MYITFDLTFEIRYFYELLHVYSDFTEFKYDGKNVVFMRENFLHYNF